MNLKIILSNIELNLIDTSFTMVEENNWFSSKVFSKYTYSISHTLSDEESADFGFLTDNNAVGYSTVFNCLFYVLDKEYQAVMEIDKVIGNTIEFQIRYGFEEFPNFEKKLASLPLMNFSLVNETMFEHAATIITQTYPAVNYNFPQIITSRFSPEEEKWEAFEGVINNYKNNLFLLNEYELSTDTQINRNVIQPCPYILYVLQTGFLDAGYTLTGQILEDPEFKKATLFSLNEYYTSITSTAEEYIIKTDDFIGITPSGFGEYEAFFPISGAGRYKISGNFYLRYEGSHPLPAQGFLFWKDNIIGHWESEESELYILMDVNIDLFPGELDQNVRFVTIQLPYQHLGGQIIEDALILDISIVQLTKYDPAGNPSPTLVFPEVINLPQSVPNITFGKLFEIIKAWKNYDITITGNVVSMNLVNDQIGTLDIIDLSEYEVKYPERTFNQGKKYELKFPDIDSDEHTFASLYVTNTGVEQSPYVKSEDTEEILIDAVPLPMKTFGEITTADGFLEDDSQAHIVLYDGLQNGLNLAKDPSQLLLPNIYENYYRKWFTFLLKSVIFKWEFITYDENIKELAVRSTPAAYSKLHVVKSIKFKNLKDGIVSTEIETYSIE